VTHRPSKPSGALAVRTDSHTSFDHGARGTNLAYLMVNVPGPTVTMVGEADVVALAVSVSRLDCALKAARRAIHEYAGLLGRMCANDTIEWGIPHGYEAGEDVYEHGLRWVLLVKKPVVEEITAKFIE